jgi:UDP-N-acetylmuramate dehydrogenase
MIEIQKNIPLAPLTTFQIGGPARYFVDVTSEDQIREAISFAHDNGLAFEVLAGGSNVLIPDIGLDKLVIHIVAGHHSFSGRELEAFGGCNLKELMHRATERGLGGWEKLYGIPGTIGGAIRGNAGAFGSEIKDFTHQIKAINRNTGKSRLFTRAECGFMYRHSFFKHDARWLVTTVHVHLDKIRSNQSMLLCAETLSERERRHLQNVQAAGSFFMNPVAPEEVQKKFEVEKNTKSREGRVPAGWLIEKVGMKGARVGGAMASEQHPNYLVNTGVATATDVLELAGRIQEAVYQEFAIELQEEASIL